MSVVDPLGCLCALWERGSTHPSQMDEGSYLEILEMLAAATDADRASLMVRGISQEELVIGASIGLPPGMAEKGRVPTGESISSWVVSHQRPLLVAADQDLPEPVLAAMKNPSIKSAVSVPIVHSEESLGVLNLARCESEQRFDHTHVQFATLAGMAMASLIRPPSPKGSFAESELPLSRVLDAIPSSTVIVDRRLRVVAANQVLPQRTRGSRSATLGRSLADVVPRTLLDQAGATEKIELVFRMGIGLDGGRVAYQEPNSPARVYFIRFAPVVSGPGEEVQNVMVLMDDITEQERLGAEVRQAERVMVGMKASEQDIVIWLNPRGQVVSWNRAAEAAIGLGLDRVQGESMAALCVPADREVCQVALSQVAAGTSVRGLELALSAQEHQNVTVSWHCSPIGDDDGMVSGILAVGRDLTERRQMERLLIQSDKLASLGVMAGGIAHELRNPLAIISMSAGLAQAAAGDEAFRQECFAKINASAQRAAVIVDNLLRFARPQTDKAVVVDVEDLLETTLKFTSDEIALRRVKARVEASGDGARVIGSPTLLQQVFINLVLNACGAMPNGGDLVTNARMPGDGTVRVTFRDTGEGIPSENLSKLFDPFFTTRPPGSGVGLGLSITLGIVKQYGGSIDVESKPGQGSTFTVVLPGA